MRPRSRVLKLRVGLLERAARRKPSDMSTVSHAKPGGLRRSATVVRLL